MSGTAIVRVVLRVDVLFGHISYLPPALISICLVTDFLDGFYYSALSLVSNPSYLAFSPSSLGLFDA